MNVVKFFIKKTFKVRALRGHWARLEKEMENGGGGDWWLGEHYL